MLGVVLLRRIISIIRFLRYFAEDFVSLSLFIGVSWSGRETFPKGVRNAIPASLAKSTIRPVLKQWPIDNIYTGTKIQLNIYRGRLTVYFQYPHVQRLPAGAVGVAFGHRVPVVAVAVCRGTISPTILYIHFIFKK